MSTSVPSSVPAPELALARSHGRVSARYAAYPPLQAFRAECREALLLAKRDPAHAAEALALYVHMPFCYTACSFCTCVKTVTHDGGKASRYLDYLEREIAAHAGMPGAARPVTRMAWGGGTPTYYTMLQLRRVWRALRRHFTFVPDGEYSIEVDPRTVGAASFLELRDMGFTIVGLTVPDLNQRVLDGVARPQLREQSLGVISAALYAGFRAVGVDMLYGLPQQTAASFIDTLAAIIAMQPDRIILHDYVHAPRRYKAQRQFKPHEVPRVPERFEMLGLAVDCLASAGYVHIGPDCFVRGADPLAAAHASGRVHFDMMGYSAAGATDLVGIGVSAVSATESTYAQNEIELGAYYERLGVGELPIARGIALAPDDAVRRAVMRLVLCRGRVAYADIERQCSLDFERYFAAELEALKPYAGAGLVRVQNRAIEVLPRGRLWARNICSVFDRYREARRETAGTRLLP